MSVPTPDNIGPRGSCVGLLPAAGSPLTFPTREIVIQTAGNLGVVFNDGTNNDSHLIAVTAGMAFQWACLSLSASNTAVVLGFR